MGTDRRSCAARTRPCACRSRLPERACGSRRPHSRRCGERRARGARHLASHAVGAAAPGCRAVGPRARRVPRLSLPTRGWCCCSCCQRRSPAQPRQRHEVRHLPEVEPGRQDGGARVEAARGRRPAHERRHRAHHRPDPGVGHAERFEGSVDPRIQRNVAGAKGRGQRIGLRSCSGRAAPASAPAAAERAAERVAERAAERAQRHTTHTHTTHVPARTHSEAGCTLVARM